MAPPHSGQMQFTIADLTSSLPKLRLCNIRPLYVARQISVLTALRHRTCLTLLFVY